MSNIANIIQTLILLNDTNNITFLQTNFVKGVIGNKKIQQKNQSRGFSYTSKKKKKQDSF